MSKNNTEFPSVNRDANKDYIFLLNEKRSFKLLKRLHLCIM